MMVNGRILVADQDVYTFRMIAGMVDDEEKVLWSGSVEEVASAISADEYRLIIACTGVMGVNASYLLAHAARTSPRARWVILDDGGAWDRSVYARVAKILPKPLLPAQIAEILNEDQEGCSFLEAQEGVFLGYSPCVQELMKKITKVASDDTLSVLLLGETGTGKELLAQYIHQSSSRSKGPFIPVHCAGLAESIIESELFGSEPGAFTEAKSRKGLLEAADGGTLFLDEIGDMPIGQQRRMLRFLCDGRITRLGSSKTVQVSVRVIAATNRDLIAGMYKGEFREDLYYRIAEIDIRIPPLREHPEDIPGYAMRILHDYRRCHPNAVVEYFASEVLQVFQSYNWPGNYRQLMNVITKLAGFGEATVVSLVDLHEHVPTILGNQRS